MADSTASLALLTHSLRERYRLERELGRGGMATVYLAHDLQHDRPVALKLLRPELSATVGIGRFLREIQLTARLQHPGILPLFDSGEAQGQLWYTLPYVEGGTLRGRLGREGRLAVADAVGLVRQVAEALDYAHQQGVIHRDIKPENILLRGPEALVADFGIARVVDLAGEQLTATGLALGTPAYMSPEQVAGRGRLDGRSDVYSLACVLYELLAGEPPFTGPNAQAVIAKRLTASAPRVRVVRPEVPVALEQVITQALARSPADRHATAAAFASALERALRGAASAQGQPPPKRLRLAPWAVAGAVAATAFVAGGLLRHSPKDGPRPLLNPNVVAVLPFRVTAPDSASNYLREGVVDLLNARLTGEGIPRAVDSRTMLSRWRRAGNGRELSTAQAVGVAEELGAGQLLIGEITRTAAQTTVRGRLLRVPSGGMLTEHSETAPAGGLDELGLIDRWVGRVFASGEGAARLAHLSDSAEAVKAYLAGRQAHKRGEIKLAVVHYNRALEIDSTFALAALWLVTADEATGTDVEESARRAWALRDRLSERDRAQLLTAFEIGPRYPGPSTPVDFVRAAERAAQLNPGRSEAQYRLGLLLVLQGAAASSPKWLPRAVAALDSALVLDSTYQDAYTWQLYARLIEGDYAEVGRLAKLYLRTDPRADWSFTVRWVAALATGDSASLHELSARFDRVSRENRDMITAFVVQAGLRLEPLDRALTTSPVGELLVCQRLSLLQIVAAARGQVARALGLADSANRLSTCGLRRQTMQLALADPGYATGVDAMARELAAHAEEHLDGLEDPEAMCLAALWRVSGGDRLRARRGIQRIQRSRARWPGSGTCVLLVEAGLEALNPEQPSAPALARLDEAMLQDVFLSPPVSFANLLLARRLSARGDLVGALAAVRRHPYHSAGSYARLRPAFLQEEGRLAALTGDTAGAIRAYRRYLRLRDRPDPGPMEEQVARVKAHLGALLQDSPGK